MSRIGRMPIPIPSGVEVTIEKSRITVKGPKGQLVRDVVPDITVREDDGQLLVERPTDQGRHRALHGLTRTLIANMVDGVNEGFAKTLEIVGVGYRAALKGKDIELQIGYSHPVTINAPEGITFEVPMPTRIRVRGIDKQQVGEVAAEIRDVRKPEPYKGKGIRYEDEHVRRKAGKTAK